MSPVALAQQYKDNQMNKQAFKLADAVDGEIGEEMKECPYCAEKMKNMAAGRRSHSWRIWGHGRRFFCANVT